jgi:hypothetical protein
MQLVVKMEGTLPVTSGEMEKMKLKLDRVLNLEEKNSSVFILNTF